MKAIRRLKQEDLGTIRTIFFDTVNKINKTDYDKVQREAWTDASDDLQLWTNSFRDKIAYVVEKDSEIVGFIDGTIEGYIDRIYVHHDYQSQGVATMLLSQLEQDLMNKDVNEFYVYASITAKSFFESHG